ncbi:MAG: hypothetical protein U1D30_00510 [Planctomycetota bacterium]
MAKKTTSKKRNDAAKRPTKADKRTIEQYSHGDKSRVNNPPVGLVTPSSDPLETVKKTYAYDPNLEPQLVWTCKAERTSFEVPTVSLHVPEHIDPKTIEESANRNGEMEIKSRIRWIRRKWTRV